MRSPSLAEQALAQIKAKGYHEKHLRQGKKVTLVGAAFDAEMRNLSDRVIETVGSTCMRQAAKPSEPA